MGVMRPYDVVYDNYDNLLSCMCQADEKNLFHETILNVRNCCGIVIIYYALTLRRTPPLCSNMSET